MNDTDELFDALSDKKRRQVLLALLEADPGDESIAVGKDVLGTDTSESVVIELTHVHHPKLVEYDLIRWDRRRDRITEGPAFDDVRPALELLRDNPDALPDGWL